MSADRSCWNEFSASLSQSNFAPFLNSFVTPVTSGGSRRTRLGGHRGGQGFERGG
jgi:hypothetical protein